MKCHLLKKNIGITKIRITSKSGIVAHVCNLSAWKAKSEDQPGLQNKILPQLTYLLTHQSTTSIWKTKKVTMSIICKQLQLKSIYALGLQESVRRNKLQLHAAPDFHTCPWVKDADTNRRIENAVLTSTHKQGSLGHGVRYRLTVAHSEA